MLLVRLLRLALFAVVGLLVLQVAFLGSSDEEPERRGRGLFGSDPMESLRQLVGAQPSVEANSSPWPWMQPKVDIAATSAPASSLASASAARDATTTTTTPRPCLVDVDVSESLRQRLCVTTARNATIVSTYRSGTWLLRALLHGHPRIHDYNEVLTETWAAPFLRAGPPSIRMYSFKSNEIQRLLRTVVLDAVYDRELDATVLDRRLLAQIGFSRGHTVLSHTTFYEQIVDGPNGALGAHWTAFLGVVDKHDLAVIHLVRQSRLEGFASHHVASGVDQWHAFARDTVRTTGDETHDGVAPKAEVAIDYVRTVEAGARVVRDHFTSSSSSSSEPPAAQTNETADADAAPSRRYYELTYESLVDDAQSATESIRGVLQLLGLPHEDDVIRYMIGKAAGLSGPAIAAFVDGGWLTSEQFKGIRRMATLPCRQIYPDGVWEAIAEALKTQYSDILRMCEERTPHDFFDHFVEGTLPPVETLSVQALKAANDQMRQNVLKDLVARRPTMSPKKTSVPPNGALTTTTAASPNNMVPIDKSPAGPTERTLAAALLSDPQMARDLQLNKESAEPVPS